MTDGLVASTYTSLWREDLDVFCAAVAAAGFRSVEVLAAPPEVDLEDVAAATVRVRRAVGRAGLQVNSVVPSGVDVNLAAVQAGMRGWSRRQFVAATRLAGSLGAPFVVVHPGRRHPLRPPPVQTLVEHVVEGLHEIVRAGREEGVQVLVENVPTGLLDTAGDCVVLTEEVEGLGVCYDVANGFMVEDVAAGLRAAAPSLGLVHVSDTRRDRWLHAPLGTGEVAWDTVVGTLDTLGYDGAVVLETLHEERGAAGLARDAALFARVRDDVRQVQGAGR